LNFLDIHYSVTYGLHDRTERIQRIKLIGHTHSAHTKILVAFWGAMADPAAACEVQGRLLVAVANFA
jgi:hypothetical protein